MNYFLVLFLSIICSADAIRILDLLMMKIQKNDVNNQVLPLQGVQGVSEILGGMDTHGCITSAGYSYCNYTNSCNRFNEPCIFNIIYKK